MSEWDIKEKIPVPESNGNSHWIYSALLGRKAPHWNLAPVRRWTKDSKRVTLFWEHEGERFSVLIYWEFNTVVKESIDVSLATSSYHSGYSFSGFWEEFRPKKKKDGWEGEKLLSPVLYCIDFLCLVECFTQKLNIYLMLKELINQFCMYVGASIGQKFFLAHFDSFQST